MKHSMQTRHWFLLLAWAAFACGIGLVYWMTPGDALEALGQADRRFEFSQVLARWGTLGQLRWVLFFDSTLIVPGYVGLFILFARRVFARGDGRVGINMPLHLLIAAQVFAGLVDLVENGVTMRAAEDSVAGVLADAMLADLHLLTALKWGALGAAWLALGWKAFFARIIVEAHGPHEVFAWRFAGLFAVVGGFLLVGYALGQTEWRTVGLLTWFTALLVFTFADATADPEPESSPRIAIAGHAPEEVARD
ncbi:hypothetical protein ACSFBF_09650 [Variovorax sp. ZT5P49]|uniref:hypothetical protein n=1 Tax=Variovorax sp. ZT5P49 TaxID=3443733 RepID=UPI003F455C24